MAKTRKMSPEKLLKKFSKKTVQDMDEEFISSLSTPQLSDAMKKVTGTNGVIPDLKSVNDQKVFGSILTAKTKDKDWGTSVKAIDMASKGEVLFIFTEGSDDAVWGELTSKAAEIKGIAGIMIYGACRDFDAIKKMSFPVFSKKIIPNAGSPLLEGDINVTLDCNGLEVNPGDFVLGDECGVVLVPQNILKDVLKKAKYIKSLEKNIIDEINSGNSLLDILDLENK